MDFPDTRLPIRRRFLGTLGALGTAAAGTLLPLGAARADDEPTALQRIRERGVLSVGLYDDLKPFHLKGQGIEVDMAKALAAQLGVQAKILPFPAGENMDDDLRNMVWRGHYLGYGPADVLLHVPVDRPLMQANPRVTIFGPYWHESVVIARDVRQVPELDGLAPLRGKPVAVPGLSLAGWLLLGADDGMLKNDLITKLPSGVEAAQMLQRGEVVAAAGLRSEMEATLQGAPRYVVSPLPIPRAPTDGWAVGMAVKRDSKDLAEALQAGVQKLSSDGTLKKLFAQAHLNWRV